MSSVYRRFRLPRVSEVRAILARSHPSYQRQEGPLRRALTRSVPVDATGQSLYDAGMESNEPGQPVPDDVTNADLIKNMADSVQRQNDLVNKIVDSDASNTLPVLLGEIYDRLGVITVLLAKGLAK